jgi:hypothetical protein
MQLDFPLTSPHDQDDVPTSPVTPRPTSTSSSTAAAFTARVVLPSLFPHRPAFVFVNYSAGYQHHHFFTFQVPTAPSSSAPGELNLVLDRLPEFTTALLSYFATFVPSLMPKAIEEKKALSPPHTNDVLSPNSGAVAAALGGVTPSSTATTTTPSVSTSPSSSLTKDLTPWYALVDSKASLIDLTNRLRAKYGDCGVTREIPTGAVPATPGYTLHSLRSPASFFCFYLYH